MKKTPLYIILLFGMIAALSESCYYDIEEELYGTPGECDTLNVSYSLDVEPIVNTFCIGCHAASVNLGGVTIQGYSSISTYVENGKLLCAIQHVSGCSPMPKNSPQLNECSISLIESWIQNGALNN